MFSKVFVLAIVFSLASPFIAFAQENFVPFVGEVTADRVNVRAGENPNFEKLFSLNQGDEIVIYGKSYSWLKTDLAGKATVFIIKKYIQNLGDKKGKVIADQVNVRAGPSINHTILAQLKQNVLVTILKELEEWYEIEPVEGTYGWIAEEFVVKKYDDVQGYLAEKQKAKEEQELVVQRSEEEKKKPVIVSGFLKALDQPQSATIQYQISDEQQPLYYVRGLTYPLKTLQAYKVQVEGRVDPQTRDAEPHPTLNISSVRLLL